MSSSLIYQSRFWEVTKAIMEVQKKCEVKGFLNQINIDIHEFYNYLNFLKTLECDVELSQENGLEYFKINKIPQVQLNFSLLDYLSFQAHFPYLSKAGHEPFHQILKNKLQHFEMTYSQLDLWNAAETFELNNEIQVENHQYKSIINKIDEAIIKHQKLLCYANHHKKIEVIPRRIVYLEGDLCLIGESSVEKCLINLSIKEIKNLENLHLDEKPNFSKIEVDDFIASIRAIADNEIRLILKVYNLENFEPLPEHHYFGHPCLITNPQGEYIWAASIEPSEAIFDWLLKLGNDIEILDPVSFKKDFLNYCEKTLKKIA